MAESTEVVVGGGRKKAVKKRPFWVSGTEVAGLKTTPQDNIADRVVGGVPQLNVVEKGDIVGAWTRKDGLLIYHFYKRDRKEIYDQAQAEMDRIRDEERDREVDRLQAAVANGANIDLANAPWWTGFEELLNDVFGEHFKYSPRKITYYPETDSYSVMMPEPSGPVSMPTGMIEAPFSMVALRVGAKSRPA